MLELMGRRFEKIPLSLSASQRHVMNSLADANGVVKVNLTRFEGLVLTTDNGDTVFESIVPNASLATETYVVKDIDGQWYLLLVE